LMVGNIEVRTGNREGWWISVPPATRGGVYQVGAGWATRALAIEPPRKEKTVPAFLLRLMTQITCLGSFSRTKRSDSGPV
jgi:hypothetical protein